ncbi:MAG: hypothetical protein ACOC3Z_01400 [Nanoarchaeota archaeon]
MKKYIKYYHCLTNNKNLTQDWLNAFHNYLLISSLQEETNRSTYFTPQYASIAEKLEISISQLHLILKSLEKEKMIIRFKNKRENGKDNKGFTLISRNKILENAGCKKFKSKSGKEYFSFYKVDFETFKNHNAIQLHTLALIKQDAKRSKKLTTKCIIEHTHNNNKHLKIVSNFRVSLRQIVNNSNVNISLNQVNNSINSLIKNRIIERKKHYKIENSNIKYASNEYTFFDNFEKIKNDIQTKNLKNIDEIKNLKKKKIYGKSFKSRRYNFRKSHNELIIEGMSNFLKDYDSRLKNLKIIGDRRVSWLSYNRIIRDLYKIINKEEDKKLLTETLEKKYKISIVKKLKPGWRNWRNKIADLESDYYFYDYSIKDENFDLKQNLVNLDLNHVINELF